MKQRSVVLVSIGGTLALVALLAGAFLLGRSADNATSPTPTTTSPADRALALARRACAVSTGPQVVAQTITADAPQAARIQRAALEEGKSLAAEAARLDPQWDALLVAMSDFSSGMFSSGIGLTDEWESEAREVLGRYSVQCAKAGYVPGTPLDEVPEP
jgi:hypothetical protein